MIQILTFTSTIHDPENRLENIIEEGGERLRTLFSSAIVSYTPNTHPDEIVQLQKLGYKTIKAKDTIISTYQTALRETLQINQAIFYCDLDRVLHWMNAFPTELATSINQSKEYDFVLFGRTKRAFETHPETQIITESIGNKIASTTLGFKNTLDVLGTTWLLTPELAQRVLKNEPTNTYGFYIEWPMTFWRSAANPLYTEVEGLEWETPDRYFREIKQIGYNKWKKEFQTIAEWRKRSIMLGDFVDSRLSTLTRD